MLKGCAWSVRVYGFCHGRRELGIMGGGCGYVRPSRNCWIVTGFICQCGGIEEGSGYTRGSGGDDHPGCEV